MHRRTRWAAHSRLKVDGQRVVAVAARRCITHRRDEGVHRDGQEGKGRKRKTHGEWNASRQLHPSQKHASNFPEWGGALNLNLEPQPDSLDDSYTSRSRKTIQPVHRSNEAYSVSSDGNSTPTCDGSRAIVHRPDVRVLGGAILVGTSADGSIACAG